MYREQIEATKNSAEISPLEKVIEKQLIFGPTYSYTYTNTMRKRKKHTFYYKGSLELAGTLAGTVAGGTVNDPAKVLGVAFSQFAKTEHDLDII